MRGFITLETSLAQSLQDMGNGWGADTKQVPYMCQTQVSPLMHSLSPVLTVNLERIINVQIYK